MLAQEEDSVHAKKAPPKAGAKKATKAQPKPAGPGAIAAGGGLPTPTASTENPSRNDGETQEVESFSATGIDNAIDLLEVVNAKMDNASIGNQAAGIERHPEVRVSSLPSELLSLTFGPSFFAETIQSKLFLFSPLVQE